MFRKIIFGFVLTNFVLFGCKPMPSLQPNIGQLKDSLVQLKTNLGGLNTKLGELKGVLDGGAIASSKIDLSKISTNLNIGAGAIIQLKKSHIMDSDIENGKTAIYIEDNVGLSKLQFNVENKSIVILKICNCKQLTKVDLRALKNLKYLWIEDCKLLTELNLPENVENVILTKLGLIKNLLIKNGWEHVIVSDLKVESLTLPQNTTQEQFDLILNGIDKETLGFLTIKDNKQINNFSLINNFNNLKELNISESNIDDDQINKWSSLKLSKLSLISCKKLQNFEKLPLSEMSCFLDLSGSNIDDSKLTKLFGSKKIEKIYLNECNLLKNVTLSHQSFNVLFEIDFKGCNGLEFLNLSNFDSVHIENTPKLSSLTFDNVHKFNRKEKDWDFKAFQSLTSVKINNFTDDIKSLDFSGLKELKHLELTPKNGSGQNVSTLKVSGTLIDSVALEGILSKLTGVSTLEASGCTNLETFKIENTNLIDLNLCDNNHLSKVTLIKLNSLNNLNLSNCNALGSLNIEEIFKDAVSDSPLKVNFSGSSVSYKMLKTFLRDKNVRARLQSLNMSKCSALDEISIKKLKKFEKLNLSGCINLKTIIAKNAIGFSRIDSIDISGCIGLNTLTLHGFKKLTGSVKSLKNLEFKDAGIFEYGLLTESMNLEKITLESWASSQSGAPIVNLDDLPALDFSNHNDLTVVHLSWPSIPKFNKLKISILNLGPIKIKETNIDFSEFNKLISLGLNCVVDVENVSLDFTKCTELISINLSTHNWEKINKIDLRECGKLHIFSTNLDNVSTEQVKNEIFFFDDNLDLTKVKLTPNWIKSRRNKGVK